MRQSKVSIAPEMSKETGETDTDDVHARTIDLDSSKKIEYTGKYISFYQIYDRTQDTTVVFVSRMGFWIIF